MPVGLSWARGRRRRGRPSQGHTATPRPRQPPLGATSAAFAPAAMSKAAPQALFALVESVFTRYLPHQHGASAHTMRAYRDTLKILVEFAAQGKGRAVASLTLDDLNADLIT